MFDLELSGKIVLITGGSDGLGRATTDRFIEEGVNVVIFSRRAEYAKSVTAKVYAAARGNRHNKSGKFVAFGADDTNAKDFEILVNDTVSEFGGVDISVNNAEVLEGFQLEMLDDDGSFNKFHWRVMSAVRLSRLVIPLIKYHRGVAIVNAAITGAKAQYAGSLPT